jgi:hypothetical protein
MNEMQFNGVQAFLDECKTMKTWRFDVEILQQAQEHVNRILQQRIRVP